MSMGLEYNLMNFLMETQIRFLILSFGHSFAAFTFVSFSLFLHNHNHQKFSCLSNVRSLFAVMLWIFPSLVLFVKEFEELITRIAGSIFHYRFVEHGQAIRIFFSARTVFLYYVLFHCWRLGIIRFICI